MNKHNNIIFAYLDELYPNAGCELLYSKDYELLIAVMLSAQTTDKRVNEVTPVLFKRYPSLDALAEANLDEVKKIIAKIGMVNVKSKNVIAIAEALRKKFNSKVPDDKEDLMSLNGVGNKTANVVRAEWFKIPEIAVDTHVERIAKRLGYAEVEDSVMMVEQKLRRDIPQDRYIKTHHQFIHFGRYQCKAIRPLCEECKLKSICLKASIHK